jgi:hypothetical protein
MVLASYLCGLIGFCVFLGVCWDDSNWRVVVGFKTGSTLGSLGWWRGSLFLCPHCGLFFSRWEEDCFRFSTCEQWIVSMLNYPCLMADYYSVEPIFRTRRLSTGVS